MFLSTVVILPYELAAGIFLFQPYYSPGYNRVSYFIVFIQLVSHILLLVFVDGLHIHVCLYLDMNVQMVNVSFQPVATTVIGFVLLVINSFVGLLLIVLIIFKMGKFLLDADHQLEALTYQPNTGWGTLWYRRHHSDFLNKKTPGTRDAYQPMTEGENNG